MKIFDNFFKNRDKKKLYVLLGMFAAGVLLLVLSKVIPVDGPKKEEAPELPAPASITAEPASGYERELAEGLESILSLVEGAGDVKVMLTLSDQGEINLAADSSTQEKSTDESGESGDNRKISETKSDETTVLVKQPDGSEKPIILTEIKPRVEGVIIVAKGGGDIFVKDALIKAVQTVLGIEPHRVQVLKMK